MGEELGHADDSIHGRTDVVAHVRKETALRFVRRMGGREGGFQQISLLFFLCLLLIHDRGQVHHAHVMCHIIGDAHHAGREPMGAAIAEGEFILQPHHAFATLEFTDHRLRIHHLRIGFLMLLGNALVGPLIQIAGLFTDGMLLLDFPIHPDEIDAVRGQVHSRNERICIADGSQESLFLAPVERFLLPLCRFPLGDVVEIGNECIFALAVFVALQAAGEIHIFPCRPIAFALKEPALTAFDDSLHQLRQRPTVHGVKDMAEDFPFHRHVRRDAQDFPARRIHLADAVRRLRIQKGDAFGDMIENVSAVIFLVLDGLIGNPAMPHGHQKQRQKGNGNDPRKKDGHRQDAVRLRLQHRHRHHSH